MKQGENPYSTYVLELIRDSRMPVIKRKCFSIDFIGFAKTLKALEYIEKHCQYDVNYIKKYFLAKSLLPSESYPYNFNELEIFYHRYRRIFIYGNGRWGKNLGAYFHYKNWSYEGHVVTKLDTSDDCLSINDIEVDLSTGFIVAVKDKEGLSDIKKTLMIRCNEEQILFPKFS